MLGCSAWATFLTSSIVWNQLECETSVGAMFTTRAGPPKQASGDIGALGADAGAEEVFEAQRGTGQLKSLTLPRNRLLAKARL